MKRIITVVVVTILCLSLASFAFAAGTTIGKTGSLTSTIFGGGVFAPSTGVTVQAFAITTAYCAGSQHQSSNDTNGGFQYHTLSSDPAMPATTATAATVGKPTDCTSATALP